MSIPSAGSPSWRPSRGFRHALACLALLVLVGAAFLNALANGFVTYDDWFLVEENPRIRSLAWPRVVALFARPNDRGVWLPLRELSYAVDYRLWGLDPFGYHLTNVGLHAANVLLAYALVCWVVGRPAMAFLGAAVFAVHPVQAESVAWVAGRRDVLSGFFFLAAFLAFVGFERRGGRRRWLLYAASLAGLACALASKATAMMLPAVLVLAVLVFGGRAGAVWRRVALCVPHGLLAAGGAAVHFLAARQAGVVKEVVAGGRLPSVAWSLAAYWRLLFFPVGLSTPQARQPVPWSATWVVLGSVAVVVGVVAAAWWAAPRRRLALFCLGWWFLLLLPVSNLVPLSMLIAERYLYLPLLGAGAYGAELVASLARRRGALVVACSALVVGLLGTATVERNRTWRNSMVFWKEAVERWPDSPVTRLGLASAYVDANRPERAWGQYLEVASHAGTALSRNPEHERFIRAGLERCSERLGRLLEARGERERALEVYATALSLRPDDIELRAQLARAYERYGMVEEARAQVEAIAEAEGDVPGLEQWLERLERKASWRSKGEE
ncbi:MAG: tetratricopeptide repeat protein [Candidatus Brocadiia bacterium]